ncbi:MAG: CvpA family protein [Burkholderiaceae bacterium]
MILDQLTGWDYLVLLILAISIVLGLLRGMIRTLFALAGWVVAFVGAPLLAPLLLELTGLAVPPWVALVAIFFVLLLLTRLAGSLLARLSSSIGLGGVDRGMGVVVGVARALLIVAAIAVAARLLDMHQRPSWQQALSRPLLDTIVEVVDPYLSSRLTTTAGKAI